MPFTMMKSWYGTYEECLSKITGKVFKNWFDTLLSELSFIGKIKFHNRH